MPAGTVLNLVEEWTAVEQSRIEFFRRYPKLVLRWLNEAQLRFADISEILQNEWNPTLPATGLYALPSDFLREYRDRVKWTDNVMLTKIDYPTAKNSTFSDTAFYSIYDGNFYVFTPAAGTPYIWYVAKPTALTAIATDNFEIPTEYQRHIRTYLDGQFIYREGLTNKDNQAIILGGNILAKFDNDASEVGDKFRRRREPPPVIQSNWF